MMNGPGVLTDPADLPFKARITDRHLVDSGPYAGLYVYNFVQVARNSVTGEYLDAPGHTGNYVPPDVDGNGEQLSVPALEQNNLRVDVGTIVELRLIITRGVVGYEFAYTDPCGCADDGPADDVACTSVRLPCWQPPDATNVTELGTGIGGSDHGDPPYPVPCFSFLDAEGLSVAYFNCDGGPGPDGLGLLIACNGQETVTLPQTFLVSVQDGTRSFQPVGTITALLTRSGITYPISLATDTFRLDGVLKYCCTADPPGLYFEGTVSSQEPDPQEPDPVWCGCGRNFKACSPCFQEIISGATGTGAALLPETLRLDVGCGKIDLVIYECPDPDGWEGPGWYYVLGSLTPVNILEGEQCGVVIVCGVWETYEEALAAYDLCFPPDVSGGGPGPNDADISAVCPDHPFTPGGLAVATTSDPECSGSLIGGQLPQGYIFHVASDPDNWLRGYGFGWTSGGGAYELDLQAETDGFHYQLYGPTGFIASGVASTSCNTNGAVVLTINITSNVFPCTGNWTYTITLT